MTRRASALLTLALTAAASAQAPSTTATTVTYTLDFADIGGTPNGTIEPGESAVFRISVAFTNQNTTATYSPPSPAPGSGTIRGFGAGSLDLVGVPTSAAQGAWNLDPSQGYAVSPQWDLNGPSGWGTPASGGAHVISIDFGQFPQNAAAIITTNPIIAIWQGLWTPTSYSQRSITFTPRHALDGGTSVMFQTGTTGLAGIRCPAQFFSISINVVPAPPTSLLLALPLLAGRRSRRSESSP